MNKLQKWLFDRKVNKALIEVRAEIQAIWDVANRRREFMPGVTYYDAPKLAVRSTPDRWRPIEDYMKKSEKQRYETLCSTEWHFAGHLGLKPEWGDTKHLTHVLGEDSPPALMSVKEDRSRKIGYEYVPQADMMVTTHNGKWSSDKYHWKDVQSFKNEGWGRTEAFHDAVDEWHAADTYDKKQEIAGRYRIEHGDGIR